jgi:hypothetical protein
MCCSINEGKEARAQFRGQGVKGLSRQCSIRMRPVNVIILARQYHELSSLRCSKDLGTCLAKLSLVPARAPRGLRWSQAPLKGPTK